MTDYARVLEHIKVSEAKVVAISKEIKDVEAEIKTLDGEIEIMKAKEKQLKEELVYKHIIVNEKKWEHQSLKRCYEIWKNMHEEKQLVHDTKNEELRLMQQNVWDTRISFYDNTLKFLAKNDFLMNSDGIESVIKNQREKNKLLECINNLENDVNDIETKYCELKGQYDLLYHLEKEKESLLEYEHSTDILRLQNNIDIYTKDLESLETELAKYNTKYSNRASMHHHQVLMLQESQHGYEDTESTAFAPTEQGQEDCEKKQTFKLKVPSFLLRKPITPSMTDKHKQPQVNKGTVE